MYDPRNSEVSYVFKLEILEWLRIFYKSFYAKDPKNRKQDICKVLTSKGVSNEPSMTRFRKSKDYICWAWFMQIDW